MRASSARMPWEPAPGEARPRGCNAGVAALGRRGIRALRPAVLIARKFVKPKLRQREEIWSRIAAPGALGGKPLGAQGIKAGEGERLSRPDAVRCADGSRGAQSAWAYGLGYRRSMQAALDAVHPGVERMQLSARSGEGLEAFRMWLERAPARATAGA